jgi:ferrochelatase
MKKIAYLLVNFGGPRTLKEVEPFLHALLTDKDVIRTRLPQALHNLLFRRVAKKRAAAIAGDYEAIGGGSPIWGDTEYIASELRKRLQAPVLAFHRYLPSTHRAFVEELSSLDAEEIFVFPFFPQFTYATTGSAARFFLKMFPKEVVRKLRWVKSYPSHSTFVKLTQKNIHDFLIQAKLDEEKVFFLFSAHGLPQSFIDAGDLYENECRASFHAAMRAFPRAKGILCYQSKFGRDEWLKPYTVDVCQEITNYASDRKACIFVPISFTSDHIETLFEVEHQYMPIIRQKGYQPYRVPAFNRRLDWIEAILEILEEASPCTTQMLVRH